MLLGIEGVRRAYNVLNYFYFAAKLLSRKIPDKMTASFDYYKNKRNKKKKFLFFNALKMAAWIKKAMLE